MERYPGYILYQLKTKLSIETAFHGSYAYV